MSRPGFRAELLALRACELDFNTFAAANADRFRKWAAHYFYRWPQTTLDVEDLAQEGLIEAWRAVDEWDPSRTSDVVRFVEYRVGRKIRVELERVLGWPNKSRGKKAVRPLSIDAAIDAMGSSAARIDRGVVAALRAPDGRLTAEEREIVREAAHAAPDALTADVIAGIGVGMTAPAIARHIHEDDARRARYGLTSYPDALRAVKRAMRREARRLEPASLPGKTTRSASAA